MTTHIDHLMHSWAWHFHMQNLQKLPESYLCRATPQNPVCRDCPKNMEKDDLFEAWRTWIKKNNRKNRREKSLFTLKGIWNQSMSLVWRPGAPVAFGVKGLRGVAGSSAVGSSRRCPAPWTCGDARRVGQLSWMGREPAGLPNWEINFASLFNIMKQVL